MEAAHHQADHIGHAVEAPHRIQNAQVHSNQTTVAHTNLAVVVAVAVTAVAKVAHANPEAEAIVDQLNRAAEVVAFHRYHAVVVEAAVLLINQEVVAEVQRQNRLVVHRPIQTLAAKNGKDKF